MFAYDKRTVTRNGETLYVQYAKYHNDRIAIRLLTKHGEPYSVASVNMVDAPLAQDHVHIKTWSENEKMVEDLEAAGIVKDTGDKVPAGHTEASVCLWTPEFGDEPKFEDYV